MKLPLVIDNEPILARELRRAKDWLRKLEQFDAAVERFEQIDQKRFVAWHDRTFHALLVEIELRRREVIALGEMHNQVVSLANLDGVTAARAFKIISDEDARYAEADADARATIDLNRARRRAWLDDDAAGPGFQFEFKDVADDDFTPRSPGAAAARPPARENERLRIKSLFRTIARKIHPDAVDQTLAKKSAAWLKKTWLRAVRAHERGDLKQLTIVHGQIMVAARDLLTLNVSELRTMTEALMDVYARRKAEAGRLSAMPAWNFSKLKSTNKLEAKLGRTYRATLHEIEAEIRELRGFRAAWDKRRAKKRR